MWEGRLKSLLLTHWLITTGSVRAKVEGKHFVHVIRHVA